MILLIRAVVRVALVGGGWLGWCLSWLGLAGPKRSELEDLLGLPAPEADRLIAEMAAGAFRTRIVWSFRPLRRTRQQLSLVAIHNEEGLAREARPPILVGWHAGPTVPLSLALLRRHPEILLLDQSLTGRGRSSAAMVRMIRHARSGKPVMIFPDVPREQGVAVALLGRRVCWGRGVMGLWRSTHAPLIPVTGEATSRGELILTLHPPIDTTGVTGESEQEIDQQLGDRLASWLENYYREHPEQVVSQVRRLLAHPQLSAAQDPS